MKQAAQGNDDRTGEKSGEPKPVIDKDSDTKALEGICPRPLECAYLLIIKWELKLDR